MTHPHNDAHFGDIEDSSVVGLYLIALSVTYGPKNIMPAEEIRVRTRLITLFRRRFTCQVS